MIKILKISYGASYKNKVLVGEFEVEVYDEIENSLVDIIEVVSSRISLKKLKKIDITIEEVKKEKK